MIVSDRQELLDAIEATSRSTSTATASGISRTNCGRLHEYTFAAAALNLQDFSDLYVHMLTSYGDIIILSTVTRYRIQIQYYSRI
jgi:hypothetical protein